jgi:hypothetical protein
MFSKATVSLECNDFFFHVIIFCRDSFAIVSGDKGRQELRLQIEQIG